MRNLPVLLFESVSLLLFLDFSPQLAVDAVFFASTLILQAVLEDTSHVSEQAERGKCCRPVSVYSKLAKTAYKSVGGLYSCSDIFDFELSFLG